MKFSEALRELAEERGLTQKRLAADLGIPASTLGGYFQGTSEPDLEVVKQLAIYFDCSVDYLVGLNSRQVHNQREETLLRVFRSVAPNQRELLIEIGKAMIKIESRSKSMV